MIGRTILRRTVGRWALVGRPVLVGAVLGAAVVGTNLVGCGSARRGLPVGEPLDLSDPQLARGQIVFMEHCHQCHPGGTAGLGFALNNKPLPGWAMRLQVRQGFGTMPAFSEEKINDRELDDLIAYLNYLQCLDPPPLALEN